jgi:hypothetical protein
MEKQPCPLVLYSIIGAILVFGLIFIGCDNSNTLETEIYTVTIGTLTNANGSTITANPTSGMEGTEITLTVSPAIGYRLKAGTLKYDTTEIDETTLKFYLPAKNVTVLAEFEEKIINISNQTVLDGSVLPTLTNYSGSVTFTKYSPSSSNFSSAYLLSNAEFITAGITAGKLNLDLQEPPSDFTDWNLDGTINPSNAHGLVYAVLFDSSGRYLIHAKEQGKYVAFIYVDKDCLVTGSNVKYTTINLDLKIGWNTVIANDEAGTFLSGKPDENYYWVYMPAE